MILYYKYDKIQLPEIFPILQELHTHAASDLTQPPDAPNKLVYFGEGGYYGYRDNPPTRESGFYIRQCAMKQSVGYVSYISIQVLVPLTTVIFQSRWINKNKFVSFFIVLLHRCEFLHKFILNIVQFIVISLKFEIALKSCNQWRDKLKINVSQLL